MRATCGTPEDTSWHAKLFYAHGKSALEASTLHEINSFKISQACNSRDNFYVGDVCSGLPFALKLPHCESEKNWLKAIFFSFFFSFKASLSELP